MFFFLMIRRPTRSTRTATLLPYTTLFRSIPAPAPDPRMTDKPFAPACERNREPILAVLRERFAGSRHALEVGSGTGQHAVHFAAAMPWLQWQCSDRAERSEEHTSELQSLMRISYAVFCLNKQKYQQN